VTDLFPYPNKIVISRPCGCTVSAQVDLTRDDDLAFAREIQSKRCVAHR
jgi:hypothetical protein